ncbi:MAG: DUF61 family protein [Candidatus Odinarchaeia archaeon]
MVNDGYERVLRALWNNEIKSLNNHLPKNKKSFSELILEDNPYIETKNGERYYINKKELEDIKGDIPEDDKGMLKLPLVFIRRVELGAGVYTLSGGKIEIKLVNRLLKNTGNDTKISLSAPYIYKPQLSALKRKYRTIISIGFAGNATLE